MTSSTAAVMATANTASPAIVNRFAVCTMYAFAPSWKCRRWIIVGAISKIEASSVSSSVHRYSARSKLLTEPKRWLKGATSRNANST